ncbi:MAG: response regulator transcription factor [Flavobacteriales bacterium]
MTKKSKILIVDDEEDILELLKYNLEKDGYETEVAENGKIAIEKAKEFLPDLILLDVMMPEMDGIEACLELKTIDSLKHTLIAFLTARSEDYSQIAGLESGADDYIAKPIKPRVLISRIKALLRRPGFTESEDKIESLGDIKIDREKYKVYKQDNEYILPKKEFELLSLLMSNPGKVYTRENIMECSVLI